jgi:5-(carboxyamino)imidazole ribonucleotide mutase
MAGKPVAIIMGSQSTGQTMKHAADTLAELGVGFEPLIVSAHRTPDRPVQVRKIRAQEGFKVVIAGAGGAAHLPGMTASLTSLPVFGVPMNTHALEGKDSLLSIPADAGRHSVGTLASARPGAINAALLAAAVLALSDSGSPSGSTNGAPPDRSRRRTPEGLESHVLSPDSTIGILGGGQLGRMLALAAARLGFKCHRLRSQSGRGRLRCGASGHLRRLCR